jgi:hypothetical protein
MVLFYQIKMSTVGAYHISLESEPLNFQNMVLPRNQFVANEIQQFNSNWISKGDKFGKFRMQR